MVDKVTSLCDILKFISYNNSEDLIVKENASDDGHLVSHPGKDSNWIDSFVDIGRLGETIIENFLISKYNASVEKQLDWVGYDYLVTTKNHCFAVEVKTTDSQLNNFYMSINELRKAYKLQNKYYIYRLLIQRDILELYIIKNPINVFGFDENILKLSLLKNDNVNVMVESVEIRMNDEMIKKLPLIQIDKKYMSEVCQP